MAKSLFSKPAFSKSASAEVKHGTSAVDLFSRADSSYRAIVEEEEKRIEKRKFRAARRVEEAKKEVDSETGARKRRCLSTSDPSSEDNSDYDKPKENTSRSPTSSPLPTKQAEPHKVTSATSITPPKHQVLELSDDEDDQSAGVSRLSKGHPDVAVISSISHAQRLQANDEAKAEVEAEAEQDEEEDEIESDDEFAELARQARETARRKQEQQAEKAVHSFHGNSLASPQNDQSPTLLKSQAINIHVESPIPGVERKTIKRRLDQPLRKVRLMWCDANDFSDEETQHIILMFRGKRVFDVNTPESLGISVDDQGEAHVRGDDPLNPLEPSGDIVMEAIREEGEKAYTADWQEKHGRHLVENDEDELAESQPPPQPEPVQESVKIICRAKGFPDFKIATKKSTTIARVQMAFALSNQVSSDIEVFVMFDGERLDPEATIGDLDIEDMDIFDIQVKRP